MVQPEFRALVVEDEAVVRQLTMRALAHEGFYCDGAADGEQAAEMLEDGQYDVVVTDLRMPNRHGHALAVDLLARPQRPLIVVLTGVAEPRLAKDLINRGVDDLMFKPVDYQAFAAKVRALVLRHGAAAARPPVAAPAQPARPEAVVEDSPSQQPVTLQEIDSKLPHVSSILPVSHAALDVFNMVSADRFDATQIAAAVQRDPALAAEVLRLANSSLYNPSTQRVVDLEEAVARVGQKRVGELALASNALSALTARLLPWLDVGVAWRRSIAAGVAVELLVDRGGHEAIQEGLLASAIMHAIGRIVLGTLYPRRYEAMLEACRRSGQRLLEQEKRAFPETHSEVAARLLAQWNIPPDVCHPLKYVADDYAFLVRLPEPTRTKAELLKLAVLIGRIAVGRWEPWDSVELPPPNLLRRLRIPDPGSLIQQTREDMEKLIHFRVHPRGDASLDTRPPTPPEQRPTLGYLRLARQEFDFLEALIQGAGWAPVAPPSGPEAADTPLLVNALQAPVEQAEPQLRSRGCPSLGVVCDADQAEAYRRLGDVVALPCGYSRLHALCQQAARPPKARAAALDVTA